MISPAADISSGNRSNNEGKDGFIIEDKKNDQKDLCRHTGAESARA